jgi:hypothetical protein
LLSKVPIFFTHRLVREYEGLLESEEKSGACHLKKNGHDVIAQKPMTLFKQIACRKMAFL